MADTEAPSAPRRPDLTSGPITKSLIMFALPTLGSNILQSLNGSINSIWVGHILGEEALGATSNANLILFLMFALMFGFGLAATILIGQYSGRRDMDAARQVVGTAAGLFIGMSFIVAIFGFLETPTLLRWMATPHEIMPFAQSYLSVIFISMPAGFLLTLLSMSTRGTSDSITPLIWMIANVAIDIVLNPLLMMGVGPFPEMGIAGSATATAIAGYVTLAGFLIHIYARDMPIRLRRAELRYLIPKPAIVKTLTAKGLPMAMQMVIMSVSALVMMGLINREGAVTTAAFAATQQLWNYISMPAMAVGAAVSSMTAQNIGANRWDRVGRITRSGIIFSLTVTATMVALLALFDRQLLSLFLAPGSPSMPVAEHIQLRATWSFIMFGVTFILVGTVRANGAVWPPVLIFIVSLIAFRLGIAWLFRPTWGADAIWFSFPISSAVTLLLAAAYYRWGGWRSIRMVLPPGPLPEAS